MATQKEIAKHLGMSDRNLRDVLKKLNLNSRSNTIDEIRLAYINDLRKTAAGHKSESGDDLMSARFRKEVLEGDLKELELAEKRKELVNVEQLLPELKNAFIQVRSNLLGMSSRLKQSIDREYGIDIDPKLIQDECTSALAELSRYGASGEEGDAGALAASGTT